MAGENQSLPSFSAPIQSTQEIAPHLDGCAGVSSTEMLKRNREALPRRVQVVLDHLKGKAGPPVGSGLVCWQVPPYLYRYGVSFSLCSNLGSHTPQEILSYLTPSNSRVLTPQICMSGAIAHHPGGRTPRMDPIFPGSPVNATENCYTTQGETPTMSVLCPFLCPPSHHSSPLNSWSRRDPQGLLPHTFLSRFLASTSMVTTRLSFSS